MGAHAWLAAPPPRHAPATPTPTAGLSAEASVLSRRLRPCGRDRVCRWFDQGKGATRRTRRGRWRTCSFLGPPTTGTRAAAEQDVRTTASRTWAWQRQGLPVQRPASHATEAAWLAPQLRLTRLLLPRHASARVRAVVCRARARAHAGLASTEVFAAESHFSVRARTPAVLLAVLLLFA